MSGWASRRDAYRRLAEATPHGANHVRNFAADEGHKGAGRVLLAAVCREADAAAHVLYIDTVADYYAELGFAERAAEELRQSDRVMRLRRMVREPSPRAASLSLSESFGGSRSAPPI